MDSMFSIFFNVLYEEATTRGVFKTFTKFTG